MTHIALGSYGTLILLSDVSNRLCFVSSRRIAPRRHILLELSWLSIKSRINLGRLMFFPLFLKLMTYVLNHQSLHIWCYSTLLPNFLRTMVILHATQIPHHKSAISIWKRKNSVISVCYFCNSTNTNTYDGTLLYIPSINREHHSTKTYQILLKIIEYLFCHQRSKVTWILLSILGSYVCSNISLLFRVI